MKMLFKNPVSILWDADGKAVGVMVETLDERFALELHTIDGRKEYTWPDAMERLKELGKEGFNEKQGKIIAAYHEEINKALEEAGGEKLTWEWAVGEYYGTYAWLYYPDYGALDRNYKYYSYQVRPLLASKQIEAWVGPRRLSGAADRFPASDFATAKEVNDVMYTIKDYAATYIIEGSWIRMLNVHTAGKDGKRNVVEEKVHVSEFADFITRRIKEINSRGEQTT